MSVVVTGATGHLGRLVVEELLAAGMPPADVVAAGRRTEQLADLAARGVRTAAIDFDRAETLVPAFAGADALLLVSSSAVGQRARQHAAAVRAAVEAGVGRIVYTSAPHADTSTLILAPEHKATEEAIRASGLPFTILRNGWYSENYVPSVEIARQTGEIVAGVGDARVASADRRDFAAAAAVVLRRAGHEGRVYELTGDTAWAYPELAAVATEVLGRPVTYRAVGPDEQRQIFLQAGMDAATVDYLVALDANIADGVLAEVTEDLPRLIGRRTTPLLETMRRELAG